MAKCAIVPGHKGKELDPGAIGPTGLLEADVNLIISQKVVWYLQNADQETILTRDGDADISLADQVAICIDNGCDLAVSVHCNSSDSPDPNYVSTWIQETRGASGKLARAIQNQVGSFGWPDGGVRTANLYFNRKLAGVMPSCIVECGFISNPYEESRLDDADIQDKFARRIALGITDYIMGVEA